MHRTNRSYFLAFRTRDVTYIEKCSKWGYTLPATVTSTRVGLRRKYIHFAGVLIGKSDREKAMENKISGNKILCVGVFSAV